jgi:hypothetical protein
MRTTVVREAGPLAGNRRLDPNAAANAPGGARHPRLVPDVDREDSLETANPRPAGRSWARRVRSIHGLGHAGPAGSSQFVRSVAVVTLASGGAR